MVIFDMDGTFADSRPFHASIFHSFFCENWHEIAYEQCLQMVGKTVKQIFIDAEIPEEFHEPFYQKLTELYRKESSRYIGLVKMPDGFQELLQFLRKENCITAVVTNSLNDVLELFLKQFGIGGLFDEKEGADRNSLDKYARCRLLMQKYRLKPSEILSVGDAESDIKLANALKTDACFAKTVISWYSDEAYIRNTLKPKYTIQEFQELTGLLKETC